MEAILALEDGRLFRGRAFGATAERCGEMVFNTAMTGYQEVLTDPSYAGQIVAMTCPHIGNYGTNALDVESGAASVEGFVVRDVSVMPSNWRATQALPQYLREHGIPGISELDTRALTRHIRTRGAMKAVLSSVDRDPESLVRKARQAPGLEELDLVGRVTCARTHRWDTPRDSRWVDAAEELPTQRYHGVAIDFGVKQNILRLLAEQGFDVTVVPASSSAAEIRELAPDGIFLSNGPGDPSVLVDAIGTVRELIGSVPIFGICLGQQVAALALGATTFKLKFGHRGANHPVKDLLTGRVAVSSQNHGYAVDPDSLPPNAEVTHVNLNDGTCAGFVQRDARLLAVQYHPESSPGPHDSVELFREFRSMVAGNREPIDDDEEAP